MIYMMMIDKMTMLYNIDFVSSHLNSEIYRITAIFLRAVVKAPLSLVPNQIIGTDIIVKHFH